MKQIYKVVCQVGAVVSWIQLFGQGEEGIWVMVEKANLKYGLGVRQVILLQVVIETTAWRPEIWDATGSADPSSRHHHDPVELLLPYALCDILQGLLLS